MKACLTTPKVTGCLFIHLLCQFLQHYAKKTVLRVQWPKNSTASLKNSADVSVPSVRFSKYADWVILMSEERLRNSCRTHLVHLLAWKEVDNPTRIARHASMVLTPPPEPAHEPSHVPDQLPLVGELGLPDQGPVTKHPHHLFKIS